MTNPCPECGKDKDGIIWIDDKHDRGHTMLTSAGLIFLGAVIGVLYRELYNLGAYFIAFMASS